MAYSQKKLSNVGTKTDSNEFETKKKLRKPDKSQINCDIMRLWTK